MTIRLGCHIWSFSGCTVREAAAITRALGMEHMDLGNARDLNLPYLAEHVAEEAARFIQIKESTGITFVDAFPQMPPAFSTNHPDASVRQEHQRVYMRFLEFAARIGLGGVTFTPGRFWDDEPAGDSFERGAEELRALVRAGQELGLHIRIEPHIESVTWTPELTLRMLQAVPGLSLTLDYSHFVFHGIPHAQIAVLDEHATHWHARQARPGKAQCGHADGTIDFARIIAGMTQRDYEGVICLEYVHGSWMDQDRVDCLSETVRLRDSLVEIINRSAA